MDIFHTHIYIYIYIYVIYLYVIYIFIYIHALNNFLSEYNIKSETNSRLMIAWITKRKL